MRKLSTAIVALATLALAAPASAAHVWLTGSNYETSSEIFTGSDGVNVRVSAWSFDGDGVVRDATLGVWSYGLGVDNSTGIYSDGSHTVDNSGWHDFLVLQFDQSVELDQALFASNDRWGPHDTDATIGYGATALPYTSDLSPGDLLFSGFYESDSSSGWDWDAGGVDFNFRDINSGNHVGNFWLIGASFAPDQYKLDGFKLKKLTYDIPTTAVPEPGTWLMMILGFGLVGGVMRREKRKGAPALA